MRMKRVLGVLVMTIMVGALSVARSEAAAISISPATQNSTIGNNVIVDILVTLGLNETVGGVSLFLGFNTSILSGVSYVVDPQGHMGVASGGFDLSGGFNGGAGSPLDLFFTGSNPLPAQPGTFKLATVTFLAVGNGTTPLTLSFAQPGGAFLSDAAGNVLPATATNGSVCVGPGCGVTPVPEPATLGLVGFGLVLAMRARRRR